MSSEYICIVDSGLSSFWLLPFKNYPITQILSFLLFFEIIFDKLGVSQQLHTTPV